MKRHLMLGTVFSAALAVGVFAQSEAQSPTAQQDKGSNQTITVTGCLKADTASPSATPGAPAGAPGAPASSASAGFILEESASGAAASPASPTEKPSPTATSGMSNTYKLTGSSSDLATLVGKKVEVKGTVQNRAGNAAGGAPESRPGSMSDSSKTKQLRVTSVKEVSGSCSQ